MENLPANLGFGSFLPFQEAVVHEILNGNNKDVIVSLSPSGGKTSAFQIAGSANADSMVLVICPDLELIEQQVNFLNGLNLRAEAITSNVVAPERYELSDELRDGGSDIRFFYVTPEMIGYKGRVAELIEELCEGEDFSFVVVDDALITNGFRENVEYLRELREVNPNLKWIIMTSDADEIDEIREEFQIMNATVISDAD